MTPAEYLVLWDYKYGTDPAYAKHRDIQELDETWRENEGLLL
ncbi:hypothetical protein [Pseudoalteromonas phage PHS21]|nr:hypothetical protein [Pseudoalteromonas phage PHS21]